MKHTNLNVAPQQAIDIIEAHTMSRLRSYLLSCLCIALPPCWFVACIAGDKRKNEAEFDRCGTFPNPLTTNENLEFDNMITTLRAAIVSPGSVAAGRVSAFLKQQFKQTKDILAHYENNFPSAPGYKEAIRTAQKNVTALEEQQSLLEETTVSYSAILAAQPEPCEAGEVPPPSYYNKEGNRPTFFPGG